MRTATKMVALLGVLALVAAACAGAGDDVDEGSSVRIVTTTNVLGDVVAQIVGDRAAVVALMPIGVDPHDFQPSAGQAAAMAEADLVVANGLGLEEGIDDLLETLEGDGATVLRVGELLDPLPFDREDGTCDPADPDAPEGDCDPHVWMDPVRMMDASVLIGDALEAIDPAVDWSAGVEAYVARLEDLDRRVVELVGAIPVEDRLIVASHEALAYFADRYGFEIVGVVVPGGSTLAAPSSFELEQLVGVIDDRDIPAIFAEMLAPTLRAEAVAAEADHPVEVVVLYTGSLGAPGSGADSYTGMILTDAGLVAAALAP